jgi:hypothetical protein
MLCGIDEPIVDNVVGPISAHVPLSLEQAARFVGMRLRRARALRMTPEFCEHMRMATANYRACLEPGNIAMALEIRDDRGNKAKDRIKAGEFLRGPREASAGVQVNINNQATPGYIIRLDSPEPAAKTIDHEAEVIPAPGVQGNAGPRPRFDRGSSAKGHASQ